MLKIFFPFFLFLFACGDSITVMQENHSLNDSLSVMVGSSTSIDPVETIFAQSTEGASDSRDDHVYKTVKIGRQVWMAENLNYETERSYCYNQDPQNCKKYGRLYNWVDAVDGSGTFSVNAKGCRKDESCTMKFPVRGLCLKGWHLPSKDDWNELIAIVGGAVNAGTVLKSTSGWYNDGNGTDNYGFSILPAGEGNHFVEFYDGGISANFWSANEVGFENAAYLYLNSEWSSVNLYDEPKTRLMSVRCLRD